MLTYSHPRKSVEGWIILMPEIQGPFLHVEAFFESTGDTWIVFA